MARTKVKKIDLSEKEETRDEGRVLADKLSAIAFKQLQASVKFKEPRLRDIGKRVELYLGKRKPSLRGRLHMPVPIMEGYVDTLMAKIDDPPKIIRKQIKEEDLMGARKIMAQWEVDMAKYKFARKDRLGKKGAIFAGWAAFSYFAESDPKYKPNLDYIHWGNFHFQPGKGQELEEHAFCGRDDLFRTDSDLENDIYDSSQIKKLALKDFEEIGKNSDDAYREKMDHFKALGLDPQSNNYTGQRLYNLVEWCMEYKGERYYLVFEKSTGLWVRFEKLKEVFESGLYPYVTWHTEDDINFMNRAPADIIYPIAIAQEITFNEMLHNLRKRNADRTLYDSKKIDDPGLLTSWQPDAAIGVTLREGQSLNGAVLQLQTPDITSSINVIEFLKSFSSVETGVTPAAQGSADEEKVGIYFGNLQQVADRLGLLNKSYSGAWEDVALRYDWGLYEHLSEDTMVKYIGDTGIEWGKIVRKDLEPDFDIVVVGGNAEVQLDELKKKKRQDALTAIMVNPNLGPKVNPMWAIEQYLRNGEFDEDEIRVAMDVENYGNAEILAKAAKAISDIEKGKQADKVYEANNAFLMKIYRAAVKYQDSKPELFDKLMDYLDEHKDLALQNDMQLARIIRAKGGMPAPTEEDLAVAPGELGSEVEMGGATPTM